MEVSQSIKNLRERHNMTQEQFGKIAGVSSMAVSQWENGRAVPRMGAIQKLSDFFNVPKSEIIGDSAKSFEDFDTNEERELILLYRYMDAKKKLHVLQTARICAALSEKEDNEL